MFPAFCAAIDIQIDASKTYQEIEGFGTCLISWGNFQGRTYTDDFAGFYTEEVGLNMLRMAIGGFQHPETENPADITAQRDFRLPVVSLSAEDREWLDQEHPVSD